MNGSPSENLFAAFVFGDGRSDSTLAAASSADAGVAYHLTTRLLVVEAWSMRPLARRTLSTPAMLLNGRSRASASSAVVMDRSASLADTASPYASAMRLVLGTAPFGAPADHLHTFLGPIVLVTRPDASRSVSMLRTAPAPSPIASAISDAVMLRSPATRRHSA